MAQAIYSDFRSFIHMQIGETSSQLEYLRKMRMSKQDLPAFVFGNGPSLNLLNVSRFDEFRSKTSAELFVVNKFHSSKMATRINPEHLVLSGPSSFSEKNLAVLQSLGIEKRLDTLWIPAGRSVAGIVKPKNIVFFNDRQSNLLWSKNIIPTLPRGYVSMTAYKALAIAVYLRFNPIYLLGIDNSYLDKIFVDAENRVFRTDIHFDSGAYPNDSSRDYWPSNQGMDVGSLLRRYAKLFDDFSMFPENVIQHLDPNSLVDAFPKNTSLNLLKLSGAEMNDDCDN